MVITEISMIHHVGIVLILLWLLNSYNCCHPILYFVSLIYLYQILTDSETVRWLNYAVEKIWPICMEQIVSQRIFLPIIPWFLKKYKPWTVKRAVVQHLYLGRSPPLLTDIRVLHDSTEDDHLVVELGLNFLTADDMNAILAAKLRKRLGFGIVTKMHLTGMHVEGRVLVGVKFLRSWPFIGRLRVCFAEPPYFQMTVKPIFNHGVDVTELPGIAGWLDKLLAVAFEETLVEPNMLVVDMEKFVSPESENWFSVDVKETIAYANVEVIEATELKASDLNGLSDPYVKGHLGQYRFKTQVQRKTLSPKWQEEFRIPICSWDGQNLLEIKVLDKDRFSGDDILGNCSVNINEFRDGHRHDMWLALEKVKVGRLHLAITVVEAKEKDKEKTNGEATMESEKPVSLQNEVDEQGPIATTNPQSVADTFEEIDVEGQKETGMWVQHPGSEVSQTWEPRKGRSRCNDTEILSVDTPRSSVIDSSSDEGDHNHKRGNIIKRGFDKLFHGHHENDDHVKTSGMEDLSPHANIKAAHIKKVGVNLVVDDELLGPHSSEQKNGGGSSNEGSGDNSGKHNVTGKAKKMLKNAKNSARRLKQTFSRKGSKKNINASDDRALLETDSSDDESLSSSLGQSVEGVPIRSSSMSKTVDDDAELKEHVLTNDPNEATLDAPVQMSIDSINDSEGDKELSVEKPCNETQSGEGEKQDG